MTMTTSIALIPGGSGYFGSRLRDRLRERGQAVRVFDLADADDRPKDVGFIQGDIRDPARVAETVKNCDTIYHCVAQVPLAKDKELFHSVNVHGTENLLGAALETKVRKVIPSPGEAYGRAKLEGETLCRDYAQRGLDVTIIRPRTIMGDGRLGIFQILFEWIREGYNVPVLGRGDNVYQFVHADDLAEACILAAARSGPTTYNCGGAKFGTMREALEHLCLHARTGSRVTSLPMAPAVGVMQLTSALCLSPLGAYHTLMYGRSLYFDISKAQGELNWQPRFSTDEMFAHSYDWYLANREKILRAHSASHHRSPVKQGILSLVKHLL